MLTVKRNQPSALPWDQVPAVDLSWDKGHGRSESRTVKLTGVIAVIGFQHAPPGHPAHPPTPLADQRTSHHTETVYAIIDLSWGEIHAASPFRVRTVDPR